MVVNDSISFTAASVSAKCGVTVETAHDVIKDLENIGFTAVSEIDLGGEKINVFRLIGNQFVLILTVLRIAEWIAKNNTCYNGFRGTRPDAF